MALSAISAIVPRFRVEGYAMEPNLHSDQFVLVNPYVYLASTPARGDVIVFRFPLNPRTSFIKRVIGLPGEKVEVRGGQVVINDTVLREPVRIIPGDYDYGPTQLGQDEYFVLGDNRPESSDSHIWGPVSSRLIIGKVSFSYWPPDYWGPVH